VKGYENQLATPIALFLIDMDINVSTRDYVKIQICGHGIC